MMPLAAVSRRRLAATACCVGMRPQRVDARVERRVGAHQRLERHGAGHVGQPRQPAGVQHGQRPQPRHEMRAVEQRQPFLGLERQRPHAGGLQRLARRHAAPCPTPPRPSPIRQAATCASGARSPDDPTEPCSGTTGCTPRFRHATRVSTTLGRTPEAPRASEAASSRIIARVSASASGGTNTAGVAQHEVALQRGALGRRNHHVLELADAGGDAVDRLGAAGEPIDERAAGRQPLGGGGAQRDLAAPARHVLDVAECERPAVQDQRAQIAQPFVSAATPRHAHPARRSW